MKSRPQIILLAIYLLFIIYGSLFPMIEWRLPHHDMWSEWMQRLSERDSRSDILTNVLVYIPFGFLLLINLPGKFGSISKVILVTALGTMLSVTIEYLQLYLPSRTSSLLDVLLNAVSSCIGGLSAWGMGEQSLLGEKLSAQRQRWFHYGQVTDIGLLVLAAWAAMQLAPFVPSLDFGDIKNGIKPVWFTLHDMSRFNVQRAVTYTMYISGLGAALKLILRNSSYAVIWQFIFAGTVLLCKILIYGRQLSLEALVGLCGGAVILLIMQYLPLRVSLAGLFCVAAGFIVEELRPDVTSGVSFHDFNWIPFSSQMDNNINGIGAIMEGLWPFMAIAFFYLSLKVHIRKAMVVFWGGIIAFVVIMLEFAQVQISGRYPDVTTVLLAIVGWSLPLMLSKI